MSVKYTSYKKELKLEMNKRIKKTLTAIGVFLKGSMKLLVPVDTSRLKNSLEYDVSKGKLKFGASASSNGTANKDVGYALFVELGTSKMRAQPYIKPSVFNNVSKIQSLAQKTFTEG